MLRISCVFSDFYTHILNAWYVPGYHRHMSASTLSLQQRRDGHLYQIIMQYFLFIWRTPARS